MQNRLDDLASLTRFLQYPSSSNAKEFFKENMSLPLKNHDMTGFDNLRRLMHSICIRRSKHTLNLPERNLNIVDVALTSSEQIEYIKIKAEAKSLLEKTTITSGKTGKGYFNILQVILKLRLFCNLGLSLPRPCDSASSTALEEEGDTTCIICNLETQDREYAGRGQVTTYVTACSHVFCSECFPEYKASLLWTPAGTSAICPLCTATLPQQHFIKEKLPAKAKQAKSDGNSGVRSISTSPEPELSSKVKSLLETLCGLRTGQTPSKRYEKRLIAQPTHGGKRY